MNVLQLGILAVVGVVFALQLKPLKSEQKQQYHNEESIA
jgi:hypothetical protein